MGLEETGQLNEESLEKLKWYNHMKGLNYNEGSLNNGHIVLKGTPDEVFKNKDKIQSIGLINPIIYELKEKFMERGFDVSSCRNIEELVKKICQ